jgi:hypothetical protein
VANPLRVISNPLQRASGDLFNGFRQAVQPVRKALGTAREFINPWDGESRGNTLKRATKDTYETTSFFDNILDDERPSVEFKPINSTGLKSGGAAGINYYGTPSNGPANSIQIQGEKGKSYTSPSDRKVLRHEGLHGAWERMPDDKEGLKWLDLFNKYKDDVLAGSFKQVDEDGKVLRESPRETLGSLIKKHLGGYDNPDTYNEAHSYVPDFYEGFNQDMPPEFAAYYAKYFKPNAGFERKKVADNVRRLLGDNLDYVGPVVHDFKSDRTVTMPRRPGKATSSAPRRPILLNNPQY